MASTIKVGHTLFFDKYGVSSEREYKERMKQEKQIMFHFQYGLTDFQKSAEGLIYIYNEATARGHRIDRFGLTLDRIMGLPEEMRKNYARETGLKLERHEWAMMGQVVPMQPHFGDYIISSPAALELFRLAVEGGGTTLGNFSQYFTFEYPDWHDTIGWTESFIKCLGMAAGLRDQGIMIHSNLDDGFGGQFYDRTSIIGMAMFDHYIVNQLIGAQLTPAYGNMMREPLARMSMILVLDKIHGPNLVGSMINGDTLGSTRDIDRNYGTTASYLINDIVMQMYKPTGHAVQAIPVNESLIIPTPEDNLKVQMMAAQLAEEAAYQYDITNFEAIERFADFSYQKGKAFFERMMNALDEVTDVKDPYKLCYALRELGGYDLEMMFADEHPNLGASPLDRKPFIETPVYKMLRKQANATLYKVTVTDEQRKAFQRKKVLIASADVHKFSQIIVDIVLKDAGFTVCNLGCNAEASEIVDAICRERPDYIAVSTYNGVALSFVKELKRLSEEKGVWNPASVFVGGRLNEDAGQKIPVDVTEDIARLGVRPSMLIEDIVERIGEDLQADTDSD